MYKIEFLDLARDDLLDIVMHYRDVVKDKARGNDIKNRLSIAVNNLSLYPYLCPLYYPIRPIDCEYRKLLVGNYIVLYYVDETHHSVVISRILHFRTRLLTDVASAV